MHDINRSLRPLTEMQMDERIRKLEKINAVLMRRVERSMDFSGSAFSLFQAAIVLEDRVKSRTREVEQALTELSEAYEGIREARDEAETAKLNLTAAIEAVDEGFALFDSDEKLVMCNIQFRSLMPDVEAEFVPGAPFAELARKFSLSRFLVRREGQSPEDWVDARIELFRRGYASFIQQFSDGRWLQISNKKMSSGATVIFQTDITETVRDERSKHERELDEQAQLLQAMIDHLPQGIGMFLPDRRLKAWNRRFHELLRLPPWLLHGSATLDEVFQRLGQSEFFISHEYHLALSHWLANPSNNELQGVEIRRHDGTLLSVSAVAMPNGNVVTTFSDVTRERMASLALQDAKETLELRVEARTAELRKEVIERRAIEAQLLQAKDAAEAANQSKTRFLAAASHDLLQPLNASRIFLSLLQETDLSPRQSRFATNADRAFGSVEKLLESLLDISRFESKSVETNVAEFPMSDMIQTLLAEFEPVAERKRIRLRHVDTTIWVKSDPGLLRRIVQNLLANAIRYTDSGGVLFGVRRRRNMIAIDILDTGPGIPQEKHSLIFEEFRRLGPAGGADERAMGLGLAIVDRIAKLLGHRITLISQVGRGSRFSIEVPIASSRPSQQETSTLVAKFTGKASRQKLVIVIENDMQILEGMVELLESRNYKVIPVVSGEEALDALDTMECVPDVILADYHLDSGSGLEAIRNVRRKCGVQLSSIMITADYSPSLRTELIRDDIFWIGKPLTPVKLFDALAQL